MALEFELVILPILPCCETLSPGWGAGTYLFLRTIQRLDVGHSLWSLYANSCCR